MFNKTSINMYKYVYIYIQKIDLFYKFYNFYNYNIYNFINKIFIIFANG